MVRELAGSATTMPSVLSIATAGTAPFSLTYPGKKTITHREKIVMTGSHYLHVDALRVDDFAGGHSHIKDDLGLLAGVHVDAFALAVHRHSGAHTAEDVNLSTIQHFS